jgi:hypothetical protein
MNYIRAEAECTTKADYFITKAVPTVLTLAVLALKRNLNIFRF